MMNVDKICQELAVGVREQIREAIMAGDDKATYEKEYGNSVIVVDVRGYGQMLVYAVVGHEDGRHKSPRLEQAIENAMPDWYAIEREVAQEFGYSLTSDELRMRCY